MSRHLALACLISGGGRTLLNLADCIDEGSLDAEIGLVVASREDIAGVERAKDRGFEVRIADPTTMGSLDAVHDAITTWFVDAGIDLMCLCGYLRLIRPDPPLRGRVINIHPALLPLFGGKGMYGAHVHRAVLAAGKKFSGCTVHFVDEHYDHGPTILQRACPVLPEDDEASLAARVFEQECIAYPQAVRLFCDNRIHLTGRQVTIT